MNLGHLYFDIVSNFVLRISYFSLPDKALFCSFFALFCTFCASLRLKRTVFTRLQIKGRPKGLHSFAFYILIFAFSLTSYGISSTKDYVRKNNLFMQNKANFQKVKLNVNQVLTKDYVQMDTWSIGKTKPIQSQLKPIQSQLKPIQSQLKPIQTQFQKPKIQWLAKFTPASAVKKFHLILVLHRRIMFNPDSNCEMEMGGDFAKEGKSTARQAHKLTFGPVRDPNKTEVNRDGRFESIS